MKTRFGTTSILLLLAIILCYCQNTSKEATLGMEDGSPPLIDFCNGTYMPLPLTLTESFLTDSIGAFCALSEAKWKEKSYNSIEPYNPEFKYFEVGRLFSDGDVILFRLYPEESKAWLGELNPSGNLETFYEVFYSNAEGFLLKEGHIGELGNVEVNISNEFTGDTTIVIK